MATWTLRTSDGTREGLTIYQLQELIRSGQAQGTDEVSQGGAWRPIAQVPALARLLPQPGEPVERTRQVGELRLEVGPDGRPLPPPPEVVAQLLALDTDRPQRAGQRRFWRIVLVVGALLVLAELVLLVRALVHHPGPAHVTSPEDE